MAFKYPASMAAVISDPQHRATSEIFKDTVLPFPNLFLTVMVKMVWISHVPESGPSQRDDQVPYNKYFLTLQSLQAFVSLLPIISMSCSVGYLLIVFLLYLNIFDTVHKSGE